MLSNETQTTICNRALMLIGEDTINDITDTDTKAARVCQQFYPLSLRTVLESGKWPFAIIEKPVTQVSLDPQTKEQKYAYQIPTDCALIIGLSRRFNRKSMKKGIDWDIRYIPSLGYQVIVCNLESKTSEEITQDIDQDDQILIEYVSDNGNTSSYTAAFIRCAVAQLAADICMPITHDMQKFTALVQYAEQQKTKALTQALNEDGQDRMFWVDPLSASREGVI